MTCVISNCNKQLHTVDNECEIKMTKISKIYQRERELARNAVAHKFYFQNNCEMANDNQRILYLHFCEIDFEAILRESVSKMQSADVRTMSPSDEFISRSRQKNLMAKFNECDSDISFREFRNKCAGVWTVWGRWKGVDWIAIWSISFLCETVWLQCDGFAKKTCCHVPGQCNWKNVCLSHLYIYSVKRMDYKCHGISIAVFTVLCSRVRVYTNFISIGWLC